MNTAKLALFSFTLFLSAALMFGLQPMVGKMLLPMVGGTPAGWIVAMAFFQIMLLAGYFVAHALSRFSARMQGLLYLICLGLGCFFLPVVLSRHAQLVSDNPMARDVFVLLTASVAVPFIALSATASTIQRLFTTTGHSSAKDPYFLYAASNLGSFAGLLAYPFMIEPYSTLTVQSYGWLFGYILLIAAAVCCLATAGAEGKLKKTAAKRSIPASWKKRLEWILLAFVPSSLLLAVTTHITTDIVSMPLLWVLPLGIYLLTYVTAFSKNPVIDYTWVLKAQPPAIAAALAVTLLIQNTLALPDLLLYNLGAFTIVALMCHMRLARARPVDQPGQLTDFYLMLALGGALGGVLNAFIAPLVFKSLVEYPLILVIATFFNENIRTRVSRNYVYCFLAAYALICALAYMHVQGLQGISLQNTLLILTFVLICLHPKMSLVGSVVVFLGASLYQWHQPALLTERNFYGVLKVYDSKISMPSGQTFGLRNMQHGTTLHGTQILDKAYETTPTTYYTREGPLNDVITSLKPKSIAAVGLGTGSINCYAQPRRSITFFEIDPAVVNMAQTQFTYLSKCGPTMPRIVLGDARLELKKMEKEKFDLIVLDAFSSDSVPTHLLTKEAVEIYLERLAPHGIILFHISNRYFNLDVPIAASGNALGLKNAAIFRQRSPQKPYAQTSRWIALSHADAALKPLIAREWKPVPPSQNKIWTDDYTNLLSTLQFLKE